MRMPSVSIIICTCNRAASLRRTIESLAGVELPLGLSVELLVVDNGSSDGTADVIRSCSVPGLPVSHLSEPRVGQCYARNTGIAAARGEIILFTDDDVVPPANWLKTMCEPLLAGECQAVAGRVQLAPELERPWMGALHRDWLASTEHDRGAAPAGRVGANMGFLRSVLDRVPGFDTELGPGALGFGDDTLFLNQLEAAGHQIGTVEPQSVLTHYCDSARLSRHSFLSSAAKHGQSGAYLAYHWEHLGFSRPRVCLARARLRLAAWRVRAGHQWLEAEGCPEWELQLIRDIHFFRRYLIERHRPRGYDRHGLIKNTLLLN